MYLIPVIIGYCFSFVVLKTLDFWLSFELAKDYISARLNYSV